MEPTKHDLGLAHGDSVAPFSYPFCLDLVVEVLKLSLCSP